MNSKISALFLSALLCGACLTRSIGDAPNNTKTNTDGAAADGSVSGGDGGKNNGENTGNNTGSGTGGDSGNTNSTDPAPTCSASKPCTSASLSKCGSGGSCEVCQTSEDCKSIKSKTACVKNVGCFECTQDKNTCTLPNGVCHATLNTCVQCSAANATACTTQGKVCEVNSGTCVECTSNAECPTLAAPHCDTTVGKCGTCDTDDECKAIDGTKPYCDKGLKQCVACKENAHCTSPAASECNTATGKCQGCTGSGVVMSCAHIRVNDLVTNVQENAPVCANNECVQCTRDIRAECNGGADVCDANTHRCADGKVLGGKDLCQPCVSNLECKVGQACVNVAAGAGERVCQKLFTSVGSCTKPYLSVVDPAIATADGADAKICTFSVASATCKAHFDYKSRRCGTPDPTNSAIDLADTGDDAKCGVEGRADGFCLLQPGSGQYLCTVECGNSVNDCPDGAPSCNVASTPDLCSVN